MIFLFLNWDRLQLAPEPDSSPDSPFLDPEASTSHCGLQSVLPHTPQAASTRGPAHGGQEDLADSGRGSASAPSLLATPPRRSAALGFAPV